MTRSGHINDIRIVGVDQDPGDGEGLFQSHMGPGFTSVGGFPYSATRIGRTKDVGFSGANPYDVRVGRRDGQVANGGGALVFENRIEGNSLIDTFPDSTGCRGYPNGIVLTFGANSFHIGATAADVGRTDELPVQVTEFGAVSHLFMRPVH